MKKDVAVDQLIDFVVDNYMVDKEDVPLDRSLIDEGIIDSFGLIEIATFLEGAFEIAVVEADFTRENFGSIYRMIDFVEAKKQEVSH